MDYFTSFSNNVATFVDYVRQKLSTQWRLYKTIQKATVYDHEEVEVDVSAFYEKFYVAYKDVCLRKEKREDGTIRTSRECAIKLIAGAKTPVDEAQARIDKLRSDRSGQWQIGVLYNAKSNADTTENLVQMHDVEFDLSDLYRLNCGKEPSETEKALCTLLNRPHCYFIVFNIGRVRRLDDGTLQVYETEKADYIYVKPGYTDAVKGRYNKYIEAAWSRGSVVDNNNAVAQSIGDQYLRSAEEQRREDLCTGGKLKYVWHFSQAAKGADAKMKVKLFYYPNAMVSSDGQNTLLNQDMTWVQIKDLVDSHSKARNKKERYIEVTVTDAPRFTKDILERSLLDCMALHARQGKLKSAELSILTKQEFSAFAQM